MLKTLLLDSEVGGAGKHLVGRMLMDRYIHGPQPQNGRYLLVYIESGDITRLGQGIHVGGPILGIHPIDIRTDTGWIDLGDILESWKFRGEQTGEEIRVLLPLPSYAERTVLGGRAGIISKILVESATIPLWVMTDRPDAVQGLARRQKQLPDIYGQGIVIRNLYTQHGFGTWDKSAVRDSLPDQWIEREMPEACDAAKWFLDKRMPDFIGRYGQLGLGWQLAFQMWRQVVWQQLEVVEEWGITKWLPMKTG